MSGMAKVTRLGSEEKEGEKKVIGWRDRHLEVRRFRNNTKRTWMHLVVGEHRITNEKVLRLLKPFNYFSIPDRETYQKIVSLLTIGGQEIDWLDTETTGKLLNLQERVQEKIKEVGRKQRTGEVLSEEDRKILMAVKDLGVESGAFTSLMGNMKGASTQDVKKTSELLGEIKLHDINSFAEVVKTRIEKLDFFKKIAKDPHTYEIRGDNSIHRFLENNMWILDERYWLMHSNQQLRTIVGETIEKDSERRPDFVCGQIGGKLIIVELKRPSHSLQTKDLNQLEEYMKIIEAHFTDFTSFEAYLVGHKISDDLMKTKKYRASSFNIKTYTDFIADAEKRYAEFRK